MNGKEYDYDGKLKFEGEYLNGKPWKGKAYHYNGDVRYLGEYYNGKRWNGNIKIRKYSDIIYEGKYSNGKIKEIIPSKYIIKENGEL